MSIFNKTYANILSVVSLETSHLDMYGRQEIYFAQIAKQIDIHRQQEEEDKFVLIWTWWESLLVNQYTLHACDYIMFDIAKWFNYSDIS